MSKDPFRSSKACLKRAKCHTVEFKERVETFINSEPYRYLTDEIDPDTGDHVQKIRLVKPIPENLECIAADAITNFRNTLDHMMFTIGGFGNYFPFGDKASGFENVMKGRCKGIHSEIQDVVRAFKPYLGGDDILYALHKVADTNKHGFILTMGTVCEAWVAKRFKGTVTLSPNQVWGANENEIEISRFSAENFTGQANPSVSVYIGMQGVSFVEGAYAEAVLNDFSSVVERVLIAVEAKALSLPDLGRIVV